jgi:hypothetical protein
MRQKPCDTKATDMPQFPPEVLLLAYLDLLIVIGWIAIFIRSSRMPKRVGMIAAAAGVWMFGLGLALWDAHAAGEVAASLGIGDPVRLAEHLGDSLIIAAFASTGFFWLTLLATVGVAICRKAPLASSPP